MLAVEHLAGRLPQLKRRADVGRRQAADLGVERRDAPPPVGELEGLARVGRDVHRSRSVAARKTITPPMTIRRMGQMLSHSMSGIVSPSVVSRKYHVPIPRNTSPTRIEATFVPRCFEGCGGCHGGGDGDVGGGEDVGG